MSPRECRQTLLAIKSLIWNGSQRCNIGLIVFCGVLGDDDLKNAKRHDPTRALLHRSGSLS
jgi:hypothetical protein